MSTNIQQANWKLLSSPETAADAKRVRLTLLRKTYIDDNGKRQHTFKDDAAIIRTMVKRRIRVTNTYANATTGWSAPHRLMLAALGATSSQLNKFAAEYQDRDYLKQQRANERKARKA